MINGRVFFGTGWEVGQGSIRALDAATGAAVWTRPIQGYAAFSSPSISGDTLFIGSRNDSSGAGGRLFALDASTGEERWIFEGDVMSGSPAVAGGMVYIGSGREVVALNAATGQMLWNMPTALTVNSSPAVVGSTVYVAANSEFYALDAATGAVKWSSPVGNVDQSSPAVAGGMTYVGGRDGNLWAFDASTGAFRWNFRTGANIESSPAIANGVVVFGTGTGTVYALNAATGTELWSTTPTPGAYIDSSPAVVNGALYVGSSDGRLYSFAVSPTPDGGLGGETPPAVTTVKLLALGDSYSAGVGGSGDPTTQDCWSRPSASFSGQAVSAAQQAGRSVEYENRACSGAVTADIVSRGQPGTSRSKQLDYVTSFKPDIITLTIGGNDIGFGPLATDCVINSVLFFWSCNVNADRVQLVDSHHRERKSYDGLFDRLINAYVAIRRAQGPQGSLYVLSYPTVFEQPGLWDPKYLVQPRAGLPIAIGNCFGFNPPQARESNKLGTRLGDTVYQAVEAANGQVGNVHFVDWRNDVLMEGEGLFGLKKVRVAYNSEGLCARNTPWDINGIAIGLGRRFDKDSFHPTEQGYQNAANRLRAALGW